MRKIWNGKLEYGDRTLRFPAHFPPSHLFLKITYIIFMIFVEKQQRCVPLRQDLKPYISTSILDSILLEGDSYD